MKHSVWEGGLAISRLSRILMAVLFGLGYLGASPATHAQDVEFGYASTMGGTGFAWGYDIALDSSGNSYVTGRFQGTMDCDPGPGTVNITSAGGFDIFVLKLDASGDLVWAEAFGAANGDVGYGIAVDSSGNVHVAGAFADTVDFDPGAGVFNLTSDGSSDMFVLKLDTNGALLWAVDMGGPLQDEAYDIAVSDTGRVVVAGYFRDTAAVEPGAFPLTMTSAGSTDIYITTLEPDGTLYWAWGIGGVGADRASGVAVDSNRDIVLTGDFEGTVDFEIGAGVTNLTTVGAQDGYTLKLDEGGLFLWVAGIISSGTSHAEHVTVDTFGNVYTTGFYMATVDLDPGAGTANFTSAGLTDTYVTKLTSSGNYAWGTSFGSTDEDQGYGVAVDGSGNLYTTGLFSLTVDFDPGASTANLTSSGGLNFFLSKLDGGGNYLWAKSVPANFGLGVVVDSMQNAYTTGAFSGTVDFDPGAGTASRTSIGSRDNFVLKLEEQQPPVAGNDSGLVNADSVMTSLTSPAATSVLTNDSDPNSNAVLTVTTYDATSVFGASVTMNPDGTFLYDPTAVPAFQALASAATLTDTFSYTVSDGTYSAVGTVTVTVSGAGPIVSVGLPALDSIDLAVLGLMIAVIGGVYSTTRRRRVTSRME